LQELDVALADLYKVLAAKSTVKRESERLRPVVL